MDLLLISGAALVALGLSVVFVLARQSRDQGADIPTAEWLENVSVERYLPMLRLLDEEDFAFLSRQPGYEPEMSKRLRARRAEIFRQYLRSLDRDFHHLCMAVTLLMVQSGHDRPDLAALLIESRWQFLRGMWRAHLGLLFFRCGVGTADVGELMTLFDTIHLKLRQLTPAKDAAALRA